MKKCGIKAVEGIKHDDEFGFPKSRVYCTCGWKSKAYSSDSGNYAPIIGKAVGEYVDHRLAQLEEKLSGSVQHTGIPDSMTFQDGALYWTKDLKKKNRKPIKTPIL